MKKVMIVSLGLILVFSNRAAVGAAEKGKIPVFPAGIFLSKEPLELLGGWADSQNFQYVPEWRQEEITEELNGLLQDISEKRLRVLEAKNIQEDFISKAKDIYFVLSVEKRGKKEYMNLWGAVLYEKDGFKGKSQVISPYREYVGGVFTAQHKKIVLPKVSSIKPFKIIFGPDPNWEVVLSNKNGSKSSYSLKNKYTYYQEFNLGQSPQKIGVRGKLLAILLTSKGKSEIFSAKSENKKVVSGAKKLIIISGEFI